MPLFGRLLIWLPAGLLGLATIGAYGTTYYAIGVLLPAIRTETGWSTATLSAGVSIGLLGQGAAALLAGRVFDRYGSGRVLLPALVIGSLFLLGASLAAEAWQFVCLWALGAASIGGGLFYNLTMPVTARLYPEKRAAAFSVLTLLGALASPIFYPLVGVMLEQWTWNVTLQALVLLLFLCVAPAALFVRAPAAARTASTHSVSLLSDLQHPGIQRLFLVVLFAGLANSALLLNQVPAMEATGITLATASALAGARGFFQIPGRLLLNPLTSRFGLRGSILICYGGAFTAALSMLLALNVGHPMLWLLYFVAFGGMSLGLLSPLNGLFQADVFGDHRLGVLSGVAVCIGSVSSASGALLSGFLVDAAGSYDSSLIFVLACQGLAILSLCWQGLASPRSQLVLPT